MPALNSSWTLLLPAFLLIGCHGTLPANLGAKDGMLAPCPGTPNCVSSQASDEKHRIDPFPFTGPADAAMARLAGIVRSFPRSAIVSERGAYLHATFTSALFRFVDDVEFLADDSAKVIHVRSASRLGYSDLGVNRQRVEEIRRRWQKTAPEPGMARSGT